MHQPIAQASYPDGGCNVELYTCARFVEMETLSPCMVYHPGQTYVHEERWFCLDRTFDPEQWKAMADQLATVSKTRLFRRAGILSVEDMRRVEEAVKVQLGIP
jgi:hypothetical protein